ncbi:hypothetical protein [Cohnella cellulosilytica]|uniref:hypothetical protein n=1 Tax=Cohnella cellulosilytica TaxID=986710 RepID=UPI0036098CBD
MYRSGSRPTRGNWYEGARQEAIQGRSFPLFQILLGSGAGVWLMPDWKFSIRHGQIVYVVELVENWPFGMLLQLTAFIEGFQITGKTLFNRETHLLWNEEIDRKKIIESIRRGIEKTKSTNLEE